MKQRVVLDLAFTLGLMIQFTKLADLLLRPHQQAWVQRVAESIALNLEYLRPLGWYPAIAKLRWLRAIGSLVIYFTLILNFVMSGRADLGQGSDPLFNMIIFLIGVILVFRRYGLWFTDWLFLSNEPLIFLRRYLLAVIIHPVCRLVILGAALLMEPSAPLLLIGVLVETFTPLWAIALFVGPVVLFLWMTLVTLSGAIATLRFVTWRIVEYNKGAWAAISLLVTVGFGCACVIERVANVGQ